MYSFIILPRIVCLLLYMVGSVSSYLSNSFSSMDKEVKLIQVLQNYVSNNTVLDEFERCQDKLVLRPKIYATGEELACNPVDIYKTVSHSTVDIADAKDGMIENHDDVAEGNVSLPNDEHLQDAIRNMVYLRRIYNIPVADMMEGRIAPNVTTVLPALTAEDCFQIGMASVKEHDHEAAVDWLPACESNYDEVKQNPISAMLISSALFVGDLLLCKKTLINCLKKDNNNRVLSDLQLEISRRIGARPTMYEHDLWESFNTCAGHYNHELARQNMKCRYNHYNSPFLTIAPLKEEILSVVPRVSVFREVLYNTEIEQLESDVYHRLEPGKLLNGTMGTIVEPRTFPSYRAVESLMSLKYLNLRNRLMEMVSLLYDEDESLQLIYYAPGGFIRVHGDFLEKTVVSVQVRGHRIAQAVLYLNDVILGGETVFPQLKLGVRPVKGSVLAWTNMKVDGSEELRTRHSGCPVIYGEKIIATQWFRMRRQNAWITKPEDNVKLTM